MKTTHPPFIAELMAALAMEDKLQGLNTFCEPATAAPTGSKVICTPPVLDTDEDWLIYVPPHLWDFCLAFLERAGAKHSPDQEDYSDGVVYRLGNLNPIILADYDTFYAWVAATHYAQKSNPIAKTERVRMFAALVDRTVPLDDLVL